MLECPRRKKPGFRASKENASQIARGTAQKEATKGIEG